MMRAIDNDKQMRNQIQKLKSRISQMTKEMNAKVDEIEFVIKIEKENFQVIQSKNEGKKAKRDDEKNSRIAAITKINSLTQSKITK
jgi:anti-sigma-K factor RskA